MSTSGRFSRFFPIGGRTAATIAYEGDETVICHPTRAVVHLCELSLVTSPRRLEGKLIKCCLNMHAAWQQMAICSIVLLSPLGLEHVFLVPSPDTKSRQLGSSEVTDRVAKRRQNPGKSAEKAAMPRMARRLYCVCIACHSEEPISER